MDSKFAFRKDKTFNLEIKHKKTATINHGGQVSLRSKCTYLIGYFFKMSFDCMSISTYCERL